MKHMARWIAVTVGVVLALFVGLLATRKPANTAHADSPLLGRAAPDTTGPLVTIAGVAPNGGMASLSSLHGRYVVVNFFASWCVPCQQEQPDLARFNQRHTAAGDATVMGVVFDDKAERVRDYMASHGGVWPVIDSQQAKVEWGVRGVPESFLVDPEGYVLYHIVGGVHDDDLETLLRQAKDGQKR